MTALPGYGLLPDGICEGLLPPPEPAEPEPAPLELDDEGEERLSSLSCWLKGSLLANRLNEARCPSWTAGAGRTRGGGRGGGGGGRLLPAAEGRCRQRRRTRRCGRGRDAVVCVRVRRRLHHLHDARDLEREDADEQHAENGRDDLLPLLLRLQRVDVLLARHYGAPVADAPA